MSSYEWMELQTLTSEIAASRARLVAARSAKDNRLARVLEQEVGEAERRRDLLLANITDQVASPAEAARASESDVADPPVTLETPVTLEPTETVLPDNDGAERPETPADPVVAERAASRSPAPRAESTEGGIAVWDQLTPGDIENAKNELASRREEILARQAEELKALDADQTQLDTLAEAIELFARKFKPAAQAEGPNAAVVALEEERELRLQGRA
jgi:hypothetical protein